MQAFHIPGAAPLYTNTFLITTDAGHGILIDAAAAPETYLDALKAEDATLTHILLTHGHYDHVGAVGALQKATGAKVYLEPADRQGSQMFPLASADAAYPAGTQLLPLKPGQVDKNWPANNELNIDGLTFKIYHTPGHTQGSVVLNCGNLLFSGDTLFAGSCGRTDMPGGSMRQMQESLSLLANLPLGDDTQVLPGHESFSTLGQERRTNPYMDGGWAY